MCLLFVDVNGDGPGACGQGGSETGSTPFSDVVLDLNSGDNLVPSCEMVWHVDEQSRLLFDPDDRDGDEHRTSASTKFQTVYGARGARIEKTGQEDFASVTAISKARRRDCEKKKLTQRWGASSARTTGMSKRTRTAKTVAWGWSSPL